MTTPDTSATPAPWPAWPADPGARPPQPVRPIGTLGGWLTGLLATGLLVDLVGALNAGPRVAMLDRLIADPESVPENEIAASDALTGGITMLQAVLFAATAVVFLIWLMRAYRNVEARGGYLRHGPGWVVGSWFVPILSLFRPKQIVDDVWSGSSADPDHEDKVPPYVHVWWAAFLLANMVGWIGSVGDNETLTGLRATATRQRYIDVFGVALAVLAIVLVRRITQRQRIWTGEIGHAQPLTPPVSVAEGIVDEHGNLRRP